MTDFMARHWSKLLLAVGSLQAKSQAPQQELCHPNRFPLSQLPRGPKVGTLYQIASDRLEKAAESSFCSVSD